MRSKSLFYSIIGYLFLASMGIPAIGQEMTRNVKIFMCGDVMTGRGIDQVLPNPSDPLIHESYMKSAAGYVKIAEQIYGPIQKPVSFSYIWGDAIEELDKLAPHVKLINLETSITTSNDYWKAKGIHYRMHPKNTASLKAAGIDVCSLANNHVLDWGYSGLLETLASLENVGIKIAGAGRNIHEARAPSVIDIGGQGRVIVFSFGLTTSGIPFDWAAEQNRPGVNLLRDLSANHCVIFKERSGKSNAREISWWHPSTGVVTGAMIFPASKHDLRIGLLTMSVLTLFMGIHRIMSKQLKFIRINSFFTAVGIF